MEDIALNRRDANIPPGWRYNPAAWSQRLPIVVLAMVGFGIAGYLSLFQFRDQYGWGLSHVWEPFFGDGSKSILTSKLSYVLPIPDAALGAFAYLLDAVTGVIGGKDRWRTMPWIVIVFAFMVGPLGVVSVGLVIAQPLVYGEWCTLCLASAVVSAFMIGPAMDEALASLQHLRGLKDRGGVHLWRAFWGLEPDAKPPVGQSGTPAEEPTSPTGVIAAGAAALIGIGLMASPSLFDYGTVLRDANRIVGPVIATLAICAMWEVTRPLRWANILLALVLALLSIVFWSSLAVGMTNVLACGGIILASIIGGKRQKSYGGGWAELWRGSRATGSS